MTDGQIVEKPDRQWQGRRVLVTGAGGFIGSHLVEELVRAGASVRALVRYNGRSDTGMLALVHPAVLSELEILHGDVTDPFYVRGIVGGVDTVFHLAALIAIPYSYDAPAYYVSVNVSGTLNVLQAGHDIGVRRIVHTSTSETYGTAQYTPIDERHPLQPQSPYSASKISADCIAESFSRSFGTPVATIRPFNTYGPRQSARAVIPTIAAQLLAGRDEIRLGDLRPVRDFTFVTDTARAFLAVGGADECVGQVTNVGSGKGISVGELVELIAEIAGRPGVRVVADAERIRPENSEVFELIADNTMAKQRCAWEPQVGLREGLTRVLEYVRDNLGRFAVDRYVT